jgi:hypothetical protein
MTTVNLNKKLESIHTMFWWGDLGERDYLEELGVDGRILKWIFKKWDGGHGLD